MPKANAKKAQNIFLGLHLFFEQMSDFQYMPQYSFKIIDKTENGRLRLGDGELELTCSTQPPKAAQMRHNLGNNLFRLKVGSSFYLSIFPNQRYRCKLTTVVIKPITNRSRSSNFFRYLPHLRTLFRLLGNIHNDRPLPNHINRALHASELKQRTNDTHYPTGNNISVNIHTEQNSSRNNKILFL